MPRKLYNVDGALKEFIWYGLNVPAQDSHDPLSKGTEIKIVRDE